MKAADFVRTLKSVAPRRGALLPPLYPDDEADDFVRAFECILRDTPLNLDTYEDEALELIRGWDVSSVSIGGLHFVAEPIASEHGVLIAVEELDSVVFRPSEGDYVMLDHEVDGRLLCRVARDGDSLLDSLIPIAKYYVKTALQEIDIDDERVAQEVKAECIEILGGGEFATFCTALLGV